MINNKICDMVEDIVKTNKDVLVSVKEILIKLKKDYSFFDLTYDELVFFIKNDDRFEYFNIPETIQSNEGYIDEVLSQEREKVEELGFYSGSRVKLRSITLNMETIVEILNQKVDLMMEVLINVWNNRPKDNQNMEDHLLEILSKAQKMQREIKDVINTDKLRVLTEYLKKSNANNNRSF
jgi:hypothetical protein